MGIFCDQTVIVKKRRNQPILIKPTKNGGIIVCPDCLGKGAVYFEDYGYESDGECLRCHGGGAIEVRVLKKDK